MGREKGMLGVSLWISLLSRMNRAAWAAEFGRPAVPEQLDFPGQQGNSCLVARLWGGKRQRWRLQGELEPPVAPEDRGPVKTGHSCRSGSLTPDLSLPDNDSPELTSPKAIPHGPRHEPSLTVSA